MTDDEKQAWRDCLENYLDDDNSYSPAGLRVRNRHGQVMSVWPVDDDDQPVGYP